VKFGTFGVPGLVLSGRGTALLSVEMHVFLNSIILGSGLGNLKIHAFKRFSPASELA